MDIRSFGVEGKVVGVLIILVHKDIGTNILALIVFIHRGIINNNIVAVGLPNLIARQIQIQGLLVNILCCLIQLRLDEAVLLVEYVSSLVASRSSSIPALRPQIPLLSIHVTDTWSRKIGYVVVLAVTALLTVRGARIAIAVHLLHQVLAEDSSATRLGILRLLEVGHSARC